MTAEAAIINQAIAKLSEAHELTSWANEALAEFPAGVGCSNGEYALDRVSEALDSIDRAIIILKVCIHSDGLAP